MSLTRTAIVPTRLILQADNTVALRQRYVVRRYDDYHHDRGGHHLDPIEPVSVDQLQPAVDPSRRNRGLPSITLMIDNSMINEVSPVTISRSASR